MSCGGAEAADHVTPAGWADRGFVKLLLLDARDRGEDGVDRGLWLGNHRDVGCGDLGDRGAGPFRHRPLRVAGGMTRSSVPMTAQLGMDFHAVASVGAMLAPSAMGRWLAAISQRSASGRS